MSRAEPTRRPPHRRHFWKGIGVVRSLADAIGGEQLAGGVGQSLGMRQRYRHPHAVASDLTEGAVEGVSDEPSIEEEHEGGHTHRSRHHGPQSNPPCRKPNPPRWPPSWCGVMREGWPRGSMDLRWIAGQESGRSWAGALLITVVFERKNTKSGLYAKGWSGAQHMREWINYFCYWRLERRN
jgi:hypothetical protein